eukprot:120344-Amphidinium_carterae.1
MDTLPFSPTLAIPVFTLLTSILQIASCFSRSLHDTGQPTNIGPKFCPNVYDPLLAENTTKHVEERRWLYG